MQDMDKSVSDIYRANKKQGEYSKLYTGVDVWNYWILFIEVKENLPIIVLKVFSVST